MRAATSGSSVLVSDVAGRSWTCDAVAECSASACSGAVVLAVDPSAVPLVGSVAARRASAAAGVVNAVRAGRDVITRGGGVATAVA
jgi:hypothetical protein